MDKLCDWIQKELINEESFVYVVERKETSELIDDNSWISVNDCLPERKLQVNYNSKNHWTERVIAMTSSGVCIICSRNERNYGRLSQYNKFKWHGYDGRFGDVIKWRDVSCY